MSPRQRVCFGSLSLGVLTTEVVMPTYEYRCSSCGQHIEAVQSFRDDPLTECGVCGGQLRKVFAPVGIVFKGSGFYKTDSRGSGSSRKKDSTKESTKESTSSSSSSSTEKSAAGAKDSKIA
jgi:putative FmdB family regulatory protein